MPTPVIACLHNLEHAFTGHAGPALRAAGVEIDERRLRDGEPLPALDEVDGIVSFGGEQSVRDIDRLPVMAAQAALLGEAVERELPVLGVCLGAQLLAHALGSQVVRLPQRMIGWTAIEALPAAAGDPVVGALPAGAMALHWREDGFEPPPSAVELLRRAPGSTVEAFRHGPCAWGVQFHPEVHPEGLHGWYEEHWELEEAGVTEEQARASDALYLPGQRALSDALFGGFAQVVAARSIAA